MKPLAGSPVVIVREPGRVPLALVVHDRIEIGRDCDGLLLTDSQISRRHLELRFERGTVIVTDLGSTNGTMIGSRSLSGPEVLSAGDVVTFGATTIELADAGGRDPRATTLGTSGTRASHVEGDLRRTSIDVVADAVAELRPELDFSNDQGTVTIVFSDIEGSTVHARELGDEEWFRVLTAHNDIVRNQVRDHDGREIKSEGDGFMLTFPSARRAVTCMVAVQTALAAHGRERPERTIRIRVGIHTGEAITAADGDLFGSHVILAARIANEAVGGEILTSSLVRELIAPRREFSFGEPREVELKGLEGRHFVHPILLK